MIFPYSPHHQPFDFSIFRILGGELPPRDTPGTRLKILKFMLEHEQDFPGTHKGWIINCIHDLDYRREICELLQKHGQYYVVAPLNRQAYRAATDRDQKIIHAIPINQARNLALAYGKQIARFVAVLDGDCYFDEQTWKKITSFIRQDQVKNPHIRHYTVPHVRSSMEQVLISSEPISEIGEPMPIFRDDSQMKFNEKVPFGKGDKLELLYRLGCCSEPHRSHLIADPAHCKSIGYVHHLATGEPETEAVLKQRLRLREISISNLLQTLDDFKPPIRKPNQYWRRIANYFDYQGLYSHFSFEAPEGAAFVEVGSWMGASICYWAQETKNRGKTAQFYAVDTWDGGKDPEIRQQVAKMLARGQSPFETFSENIRNSGVAELIKPLRMTSIEASKLFPDNSLDIVFLDASHDYESVLQDIEHWLPKVKSNGRLAGHDFVPEHPVSRTGVVKAVNRFFRYRNLELSPAGRTWLHIKT